LSKKTLNKALFATGYWFLEVDSVLQKALSLEGRGNELLNR
jgi:hypothetical protein